MRVKALAVFISLVVHTAVASLLFLKPSLETKDDVKKVYLSGIRFVEPRVEKKIKKVVKKKNKSVASKRVRKVKRVVKRERTERKTKARVSKRVRRVKGVVSKKRKSDAVVELERKREKVPKGTALASAPQKDEKGSERSLRKVQEGRATEEPKEVKKLSEESQKEYGERFRKKNLEVIREIVSSNIRYPTTARRMGWEGTVVLRFKLLPNGRLEGVSVLKSSGYKLLDRDAVKALKESEGKLPKPERAVVVELPIVYSLF